MTLLSLPVKLEELQDLTDMTFVKIKSANLQINKSQIKVMKIGEKKSKINER